MIYAKLILQMERTKLQFILIKDILFFLIYDIFVGSWIGVINESVAIVSIVSSFIRNDLKKKQ